MIQTIVSKTGVVIEVADYMLEDEVLVDGVIFIKRVKPHSTCNTSHYGFVKKEEVGDDVAGNS